MSMTNVSRRSFIGLAAAGMAAASLGFGVEAPQIALADGEQKLVVSLSSSPSKLDPIHYSGTYESQIIGQVTDRLIEYNDALDTFEPSLATEWTVSDDGVTYVFKIRQGVKFQNGQYVKGRELTAEDVAFSLNRSHQYSDNNRLAMLNVAEVTGDYEVTCTLEGPNASFLTAITDAGNSIVAKEEVDGWGDSFGIHLTGTGAFTLEEFNLDENAILKANPDYFLGKPNIDTLEIVFISDPTQAANKVVAGEVDIATDLMGEAIETVRNSSTAEIWETQALQINYIRFNMRHEAMQDVRVRKAMIEAVDFDAVRSALYQYNDAVAAYLPLPYGSWGYDAQYEELFPGYDPADAMELMKEAGWEKGFDITIYVSNTEERRTLATLLMSYWSVLNINATVNSSEWGTFSDTVCSGNAPVYAMSWSWYPDPYFFLNKLFSSDETSAIGNGAGYVKPEVDDLLTKAFETTDQEVRKAYYGEVIKIVMEDCAGIYYANPTKFYGVNPRVKDFYQRTDGTLRFITPERNTYVE
ncbi:MAG: ABC transporter substrate-binding protein [Coriobacteriales bacterium]|nr:ABC transporter substrate-binding protein [Coriobacteriales bacterium]